MLAILKKINAIKHFIFKVGRLEITENRPRTNSIDIVSLYNIYIYNRYKTEYISLTD